MTDPLVLWRRNGAGDETVLGCRIGSAVLAFGLGPPRRQNGRGQRLARLLAGPSAPGAICTARQVHGRRTVLVPSDGTPPRGGSWCAGEGDCLVTTARGVAVGVWTADCVPVLLASSHAVAAVHAGWRGAATGVVPAALDRLGDAGVGSDRISAALGPAIGACHYPVGAEVVDALSATGVPADVWRREDRVDLRSLLAAQLVRYGVSPSRIHRVGGCTACDPELASYRRDGPGAGRQLALAFLVGRSTGSERAPLS